MATTVTIGGADATDVTVASATSLTCVVPPGTGAADVVVTTTGGSATAADAYTYEAAPATPTLVSVDPDSVPTSNAPTQTITGTNLGDVGGSILPGGTTYFLATHNPAGNTFQVLSVTQISDTEISTSVGTLGAAGDYYFVVVDADNTEVSNQLPFTVTA